MFSMCNWIVLSFVKLFFQSLFSIWSPMLFNDGNKLSHGSILPGILMLNLKRINRLLVWAWILLAIKLCRIWFCLTCLVFWFQYMNWNFQLSFQNKSPFSVYFLALCFDYAFSGLNYENVFCCCSYLYDLNWNTS